MAKKYKNTVHKNPFRENRPKKPIPWKLIGIISASLALVITVTLVIRSVYGVRRLTLESGNLYDKRSDITYRLAPDEYQPVRYNNDSVFATCGKANFYQMMYRISDGESENTKDIAVSTDKMIVGVDDYDGAVYHIYYNKDHPLPSLSEMDVSFAEIHEYGPSLSRSVGDVEEDQVKTLVTLLGDETLYKDRPEDLDWDDSKLIVFGSYTHREFVYVVYCVQSADGTRYLYESTRRIYVPIGDLLSDVFS